MGRYRKKITLIFCFLCFLFMGAVTPTLAKGMSSKTEKLPQLIHVLRKQGATIDKWSIYVRKKGTTLVSLNEVHREANALEANNPSEKWSVKKEKMDIRYVGEHTNSENNTKETIILLAYPRKNAYKTYTIYVASGSEWGNDLWNKQLAPKIEQKIQSLFGENSQLFACVSGHFNDKMNVVLSKKTDDILNGLQATKVEADNEQTFTSVSAYTKLWKESIQSNGQPINVQLGLRKLKNETTVTLGTPIITSEY